MNPAGVLFGVFGAEADFLLGDVAAVSAEADYFALGGTTALGATLGMPLFPQGVPFHGMVLHPLLSAARATGAARRRGCSAEAATIGWEWTLRVGLTFRAGAGAMFSGPVSGDGAGTRHRRRSPGGRRDARLGVLADLQPISSASPSSRTGSVASVSPAQGPAMQRPSSSR